MKPETSKKHLSNPIFQSALKKTAKNFLQSLPVILGILMLTSLIFVYFPALKLKQLFTGNHILDPLIGTIIGSISSGNALTSYIIGGELLKQGVSLLAVTAFIVSWVTVGAIQFPAEAMMLGKKYALTRNIVSFFTSIMVAILTVILVG